ncbi:MAG: Gfo/Idh/MocA family oxidoreductase [Chitinophagaceae bacterium]|nr:MAG: Gfo/Idh/MocA family oxidoreductase [Chitinophagaceae bacterium]
MIKVVHQFRFALIGCGNIANRHAENILRIGKLIAVCDNDKQRALQFAATYNCLPYFDFDDLLKNETGIDIIVLCTPNGLHAEQSIKILQSGKNVLCEKPLCLNISDGLKMQTAETLSTQKLFLVQSSRFNPIVVQLKKLLVDKSFGTVHNFQLNCFWNRPSSYYENSWRGTLSMDGGLLFTQFSHYIDALLWLFGDIETITGFRKNFSHQDNIEFEDNGVAAIQMTNGVIGGINWSVNSYQKNMEISLTLIAEKASIRIGGEYMNEIDYQLTDGFDLDISQQVSSKDKPLKGLGSNHDKIYDHLLYSLQQKASSISSLADGLKTVAAIETIYNSIPLS